MTNSATFIARRPTRRSNKNDVESASAFDPAVHFKTILLTQRFRSFTNRPNLPLATVRPPPTPLEHP